MTEVLKNTLQLSILNVFLIAYLKFSVFSSNKIRNSFVFTHMFYISITDPTLVSVKGSVKSLVLMTLRRKNNVTRKSLANLNVSLVKKRGKVSNRYDEL